MVLHILLIILKIIGIIIAVILGLLLLLLVILLCVPVRYRLDASMPGEIKKSSAYGRVTWLLRLIRIDASFEDQELKWRVRIAWKSFGSEPQKNGQSESGEKKLEDRSAKTKAGNKEPENRPVKTDIEKKEPEDHSVKTDTGKIESEKEEAHEKRNTAPKENRKEQRVESSSRLSEMEEEPEEEKRTVESSQTIPENVEKGTGEKTEKSPENIPEKVHERSEKVQSEKSNEKTKKVKNVEEPEEKAGRFEKIKCTIVKFCDKIKHTIVHAEEKLDSISEKKERIMKELEDPVHRKAFSKVKKEAGKLLKRWKPRVIKGAVHFGFEDPYHTGQALAGLSMIYPFIGDHLSVEPDFERRILKGDVKVRGGFRMAPLVCFLWNLVWCKEIRKTYHDIREFQL